VNFLRRSAAIRTIRGARFRIGEGGEEEEEEEGREEEEAFRRGGGS